jgi:hypothetical protein
MSRFLAGILKGVVMRLIVSLILLSAAFRSATGRAFAERKTTICDEESC